MATLSSTARGHAAGLIKAGKVNNGSWSFSSEDGNKILGDPPDWTRYGLWHLGVDGSAPKDTKAHYKYPYGKNGQVYRAALRAAASRASQQGDDAISSAASALLKSIDGGKGDSIAPSTSSISQGIAGATVAPPTPQRAAPRKGAPPAETPKVMAEIPTPAAAMPPAEMKRHMDALADHPHPFAYCMENVAPKAKVGDPKAFCASLVHKATGMWPAQEAKAGK